MPPIAQPPRYRLADMCAGTGAFSHALASTGGFYPVYAHDICPHAEALYNANHALELTRGDALGLDITSVPAHDVLCAGFPCQPFSRQGAMQGKADPRYKVWECLMALLTYHHPRAFVFENVPLLLRHNQGETWKQMRSETEAMGYSVNAHELNTAVHSVVPQGRTRAYIVGLCKQRTPFETFTPPSPVPRLRPVCDYLELCVGEKYKYQDVSNPVHAELLANALDPTTVYSYRSREKDLERRVRANKRGLCPTLITNGGGYHTPIVRQGDIVRKLTPRECFNLQGFPTDYILPKNVSDSNLYSLAGNAVSYPLVQAIGERLWEVLTRNTA
jgi:DNA (cytosine-5)-methyltransferase 1